MIAREKKIFCGENYIEIDIYPIFRKNKHGKRSKKKKESIKSQKDLNDKNAARKFNQLVETNFSKNSYHVSLTYKQKYKHDIERAEKEITNYIRRLKRKLKTQNEKFNEKKELKYIVITAGGEKNTRIHHHIIINDALSREDYENTWAKRVKGKHESIGYVNADRIQLDENSGLARLSTYLVKQTSSKRRWTCSKNLDRPISRTNDSKYTISKINRLANQRPDKEFWEKRYPGFRITDKDYGYEQVYNEINGTWSIYLKLRRIEE